jgi:hypothetical protein
MLYRSSNDLERKYYANRTADYAFSVIIQAAVILVRIGSICFVSPDDSFNLTLLPFDRRP